jgi:Septum formation
VRRGPLTFTLTLTLVLTLTGCTRTPGIDGVIADQWPAMDEPVGWQPTAGVCYDNMASFLRRFPPGTSECTQWHRAEVVHIGRIADGAETTKPPTPDSPAYLKAWAECDAKTTDYLGGPWRERKVRIGVAFPMDSTWEGGARWFACQASVVQRVVGAAIPVKFGLKGKFDSEPELAQGCAQVSDGTGTGEWTAKRCDEAHNAEFVGTFAWDTSREDAKAELHRENSTLHRKCRETVGSFVGATVRTGTYVWLPSEADWKAGDRSVRCFYWLQDKTVSRSLKSVGRTGWPLR